MSEISKSIADSIKTGQYFTDGKNWYYHRYVYPSVERTFFGIICGCFTFVLAAMIVFTSSTKSEVLESTYTVNLQDTIKQEAKFQALDSDIKPSLALNNYMLQYYVTTRESYNFNELDVQLTKMSNLSTLEVYNQFRNFMSINNVKSPQFIYQKDNTRVISNISIKYISPYSAQVSFTATSNWTAYNQQDKAQWVANVNFAVSDLQQLLNSKSKTLDFVVTSYSSRKVSS
jgi:type IV secretory pathway component VirB8